MPKIVDVNRKMNYLRSEIAALGGPRVTNSDLACAVGIQAKAHGDALRRNDAIELERIQRAQAVTWSKKCSGSQDHLFTDNQIEAILKIIAENNAGRTLDRQTMIEAPFAVFKQRCIEQQLGLLGAGSLAGLAFLDAACLDDREEGSPRLAVRIERPERTPAPAAFGWGDEEEFEAGLESVVAGERVRLVIDNLDSFAPEAKRWLVVFFAFGVPLRQAATQIQAPAWLLVPSAHCPQRTIEAERSWVSIPQERDGTIRVANHPGRGSIYTVVSTFESLATDEASGDGERLPSLSELALQRLTDRLAAKPKQAWSVTRYDYEVVRR